MKLRLTEQSKSAFEKADEEPFYSINHTNGISVNSFLSLLKEIESFIHEFEKAIGMRGARKWIGERLNEAVNAGRTTVENHLKKMYFSELTISSDTAYILIENYELTKTKMWLIISKYYAYNFTVLRFMVTRLVHEDTHSHVHKTEYSALLSELVDKTRERIEKKKPAAKRKIRKVALEFTAPIYVKEKEEILARRMQRFALDAFLKAYYECDSDWYGLLGVPLFLAPHSEVVEEIRGIAGRKVEFKNGFVSTYRKILREYVSAITKSEGRICEDARGYLLSSTEDLINAVRMCLEDDYSGLRKRERERVWKPGVKI
ncbi:hypothetical protein CW714_08205 [Methanophagales archaeon]|nr:MAG: hypothetical protein CW714_08205 [Methanophagales archaeon]